MTTLTVIDTSDVAAVYRASAPTHDDVISLVRDWHSDHIGGIGKVASHPLSGADSPFYSVVVFPPTAGPRRLDDPPRNPWTGEPKDQGGD